MVSDDKTNYRELFAEAFQRFGSPTSAPNVDPSTYKNPYNEQKFFPGIYCDYVDTEELNAMACIYKGHEFVAIFAGLINFIDVYYAAFLSDSQMFQEIGDPCKDADAKVEKVNTMRIDFLKQYPTSGFAPLSACPIRSRAIVRLISCGILFLHAHEVAHIVLGHLDLLKDEFGISTYEELPVSSLSVEECDLRRVLELQADQSAALTSLHLFRKQFEEPFENEEFTDADLLWSIAVESIFVLLELARIRKGIQESRTHPSPLARWLNVKYNVLEQAEEHGIRRLQVSVKGSSPIKQIKNWLTAKGLADSKSLFPRNEGDRAVDELFTTWETLAPYASRLERYRADRGDRAVHRVPH